MNSGLRLFFAIEINKEIRAALSQLIKQMRSEHWGNHIRWIPTENLHITLQFVGYCEAERVGFLLEQVHAAIKKILPLTIELGYVRLFPSEAHPHVLAVSVPSTPELIHLADTIGKGMTAAGFTPEKRSYLPHVSLGRLLHASPPQLNTSYKPQPNLLVVDKVALLQSEHVNDKRIYTALRHLTLDGKAHAESSHPQVAVGAVIVKDGKILLVKRKHNPQKNRWAIPGGRVKLGETLQQAAEREIKEETGLVVRANDPVYVFDFIEHNKDNSVHVHYVIIDLQADYIAGEAIAGDDALEVCWASKQELEALSLSMTTRKFLQKYPF